PIYAKINYNLFKKMGREISEHEYQSFIGSNLTSMWTELKKKHDIRKEVSELKKINNEALFKEISNLQNLELMPGLDTFLEKAKHLPLAVASSTNSKLVHLILKKLSIISYFDSILCGDEIEKLKPHPEIFLKSSEKLNISPADILVIEDSLNGIIASKAAGMFCAALQSDFTEKQDLKKSDIIIKNFKELQDIIF
ncbi:MAG: HAD family phosphatase, partial [Candidatus Cloacimonadota bacterium]|nr:HAD family phosphatase [Candidatus Cloacimonadota bacterium]